MVLLRTRRYRRFSRGLVPLCLLVLAVSCGYGLARAGGSGAPAPSGPNERLRALMTERCEVLKVMVENSRRMLEAGRTDVVGHQNLVAALYRAEADLCMTAADRVKVYEKLVDALAVQERLLERRAEVGHATGIEVAQGKLVTLNAQIDLERLRLGQALPQP